MSGHVVVIAMQVVLQYFFLIIHTNISRTTEIKSYVQCASDEVTTFGSFRLLYCMYHIPCSSQKDLVRFSWLPKGSSPPANTGALDGRGGGGGVTNVACRF